MVDEQGPRFGCPKCGSERIREQNSVLVGYDITSWTEEGEPEEYGDSETFWDTIERNDAHPYICRDCVHQFSEPRRLDEGESGGGDDDERDLPGADFIDWLAANRPDDFQRLRRDFFGERGETADDT